jgi:hypothetical protein
MKWAGHAHGGLLRVCAPRLEVKWVDHERLGAREMPFEFDDELVEALFGEPRPVEDPVTDARDEPKQQGLVRALGAP